MKESLNPDRVSPIGTPSITPTNSIIVSPERAKMSPPVAMTTRTQCNPLGSDEVSRDKDHSADREMTGDEVEVEDVCENYHDDERYHKELPSSCVVQLTTPKLVGIPDKFEQQPALESSANTDSDVFTPRTYMTLVPASTVISDDGQDLEGDIFTTGLKVSPDFSVTKSPHYISLNDDDINDSVIEVKKDEVYEPQISIREDTLEEDDCPANSNNDHISEKTTPNPSAVSGLQIEQIPSVLLDNNPMAEEFLKESVGSLGEVSNNFKTDEGCVNTSRIPSENSVRSSAGTDTNSSDGGSESTRDQKCFSMDPTGRKTSSDNLLTGLYSV